MKRHMIKGTKMVEAFRSFELEDMRDREVSDSCVVPSVELTLHSSTFAHMATSADASAANAKDMGADLRNPSGSDADVLQVRSC